MYSQSCSRNEIVTHTCKCVVFFIISSHMDVNIFLKIQHFKGGSKLEYRAQFASLGSALTLTLWKS